MIELNLGKTLVTSALIVSLFTAINLTDINIHHNVECFANNSISENMYSNEELLLRDKNKDNDPLKVLESLKNKIEKKLKDREISKEKADKLTRKIDKRIKEIKEFKKLSLEEKKNKLLTALEERLKKKVEENKISQEEADEILNQEKEKIQNWDGKSNPDFLKRYFFWKKHKD